MKSTNQTNQEFIQIRGAREHNLKNIDLDIPINDFVVITGVSGSGKSSLAFDTLYAEGQRRYVESLSAYARQFLGIMNKPDVDSIKGLSPAISIEQKSTSRNPRSTVGTVTEIYDYMRLLFARIGQPHCPKCGKEISSQDVQTIFERVLREAENKSVEILSSLVRGRKGAYEKMFENLFKQGYSKVRVNGKEYILPAPMGPLGARIELNKFEKHEIEIVVDSFKVTKENQSRLFDSLETAVDISQEGIIMIKILGKSASVDGSTKLTMTTSAEILFNTKLACANCGINFEEIQPRMFSFNSPYGACVECHGLGGILEFAEDLIIPNPELSIMEGAIAPWKKQVFGFVGQKVEALARHYKFDPNTPWKKLPKKIQDVLLYGSEEKIDFELKSRTSDAEYAWQGYFEGIIPQLERLYKQTDSEERRQDMARYMRSNDCPLCHGQRLKPESLAVTIDKFNIFEVTQLSIKDCLDFITNLKLNEKKAQIAKQILKEIKSRLTFMINVGLDYLTLGRSASTLSGGEAQRIRLATQIGSELRGVLYILDEPSIGLHQRDNKKLIATLKQLRDLGNTVIVVEHDKETMESCDYLVDMGPGAGIHGGKIVAQGTLDQVKKVKESLTAQYLNGFKRIEVPKKRRAWSDYLEVFGAKANNLKQLRLKFPLRVLTCVTGVSGSGKSTLINETLYKELAKRLYHSKELPGKHEKLTNVGFVDKAIIIDQSPIGRTPRSNPATYTKIFTDIRDIFVQTPEAKVRGYKPGRFSFNVRGGRCEKGDGVIKIEMHFLPDVYVQCEKCKGKRYNRETLEVHFKNKNIADVLAMSVEEAHQFFIDIPLISDKLQLLKDVGLGYIKLGQPATTLSGGEAQRIKLASELGKRATGKTLYILDEPTTGLHFDDIKKLLEVLNRLVNKGNSVIVIEHNLDVIKTADWIIDLGSEGGDAGGEIIAEGTPEQVSKVAGSYTGQFLRKLVK
ncbi:MAG: excinuclease ABC subunit UvrA [Candidatus Parcubacteria bacterium]|nr:excinuclease ABC subunit UvrA [Candidatus Parcubacteria bacterium]